jgi:peroxisomal 2,4-dienoyl-CoA reductase
LLRGKAALVTGGGSGIGFEVAAQLSRHGAQVALMGPPPRWNEEACN